ncbi:hypothetical protein [Shewanella algae]|uniref:hypothetical protein n=1 Tax=Shewanella algae TaxID=38313 RepID=UPI0031F47BF5
MDSSDLLEFYERRYFFELELKEKLNSRIQSAFILYTALITVITYMIRNIDYASPMGAIVLFYISIATGIILLLISAWLFYKATWGNDYMIMPTPDVTQEYYSSLQKHQKSIEEYNQQNPDAKAPTEDIGEQLQTYLSKSLVKCTSNNVNLNKARSERAYLGIKFLFVSAIPIIAASTLFIALDMDISSPRKNTVQEVQEKVVDVKKLEVKKGITHQPSPTLDNEPQGDSNVRQEKPSATSATSATKTTGADTL